VAAETSALEDFALDYIVMEDTRKCMEIALDASGIENEAMELDRGSENAAAAAAYRRAAARLSEAVTECPQDHPDRKVIIEHASELTMRADYLDGLQGAPAAVPLEEHIHAVTLTVGAPPPAAIFHRSCSRHHIDEGKQVMGAAAAVAAGTGFVLMGPLSAVALGVGAAYASTREDQAGFALRRVGEAGVKAVHRARALDDTYRLSTKALTVGQSAIDQVLSAGAKYGIADRAKETRKKLRALHEFNERHKVTSTLGRGLCTASSTLSEWVSKATR